MEPYLLARQKEYPLPHVLIFMCNEIHFISVWKVPLYWVIPQFKYLTIWMYLPHPSSLSAMTAMFKSVPFSYQYIPPTLPPLSLFTLSLPHSLLPISLPFFHSFFPLHITIHVCSWSVLMKVYVRFVLFLHSLPEQCNSIACGKWEWSSRYSTVLIESRCWYEHSKVWCKWCGANAYCTHARHIWMLFYLRIRVLCIEQVFMDTLTFNPPMHNGLCKWLTS